MSYQNENEIENDFESRAKIQEEEMKSLIEPKQDDMTSKPPKNYVSHKKFTKKNKKNKNHNNHIIENEVLDDEQVESKII